MLFHKTVNGGAQVVNGIGISGGYGIHHAVAHVVLEDHLAGVVQGGPDGGQLDQHLGAVVALFHHPLHLFQVADGAGQPVDNGFLVLVNMAMAVGHSVGMQIYMAVRLLVQVGQYPRLLSWCFDYTRFPLFSQALPGDISGKKNGLT